MKYIIEIGFDGSVKVVDEDGNYVIFSREYSSIPLDDLLKAFEETLEYIK